MTRVAYRDEWPWARCSCGWTVEATDDHACTGCGKIENPVRLDRFGLPGSVKLDPMGKHEYIGVPYQDELRKR